MEDVNLCANTVQLALNVLIAGKGQFFYFGAKRSLFQVSFMLLTVDVSGSKTTCYCNYITFFVFTIL